VNALNQLTTSTRTGTLTVGGVVNIPATNVTVNGQTASRYLDSMFAKDGFSIVTNGWNSFTAIAQTNGKASTNTINAYLPVSNSYQYDLNGNLTNLAGVPTAQQLALGYDDENQLTSVIAPGLWKGEFTYDGKMRLRVRKEYRWTGSSWALTNETRTVQDGMLVVQERNSANVPTITYTRGRDLSGSLQGAGGIGGLLAMTEAAQPLYPHSYYHADGNGNVTALVGTNGAVVARYAYDAFGNTTLATGGKAQINRYRFSSKEHHDRSGLVYYGYRWYVPEVQRWVNRDPIGNKGGINLYGFIRNDPMINLDPNGLTVLPIIILPPPLTPSDCSALRDFLSDQQTMKQAYENALGTCLPVVFPPGATTIANPGMLGCFQIRDPGSRAVCIAHERSHWTQVPGLLWDMLNCPNTTCAQMDLAYQNEINAYEAGIRAGSLLYIQNCTHVSIST
jgi:RHS repeat-associated protein